MKFVALLARRNHQDGIEARSTAIYQAAVHDDFFEHHRWRELVYFGIGGIDNDEALAGGETNAAVGQFARGRLQASGTFHRWEAVAFAVGEAGNRRGFSIRAVVKGFF